MNITSQPPAAKYLGRKTIYRPAKTMMNPLDSLHPLTLKDIVKPGEKVDLIPGVMPTGNIQNIIMDFLKDPLWLKVEKFYCEPDENNIKKITLIGTTVVLRDLQLTNRITVVFDAPDKKLRINVRFETGADICGRSKACHGFSLIQSLCPIYGIRRKIPVIASAGGTYKPLRDPIFLFL